MGTITNILPDRTHDFLGATGTWEVVSAGGHAIDDTREQIKFANLGSLKVTAGSTTPIILTHERVPMNDQFDWESRAFYWVYSNQPLTATIGITVYNTTTESASVSVAVRARKWTLVSVEGAVPESFARAQITVRLEGLAVTETAYLTNPTIVTPNAISRNLFAAESWMRLPQYLRDTDETQVEPDFPLLRFLDVLTIDADGVYTEWANLRYIPSDDEGGPKVSTLDPSIASFATLRWWAQLLGVQFYDPSTGTTSWGSLESGLDLDGNGPEWEEWETVPDGGDIGSEASWEEIEAFAPGVSGLEELIRWQVQTAYFGLRGGTKESVVESIKKVLSGTLWNRIVSKRSYLNLTGATGSYASTPDSAALDLTGNMTITMRVKGTDWTPSTAPLLLNKSTGNSGYAIQVNASGTFRFVIGDGIALRAMDSTAPGLTDGQAYWLEFFYNNTTKTCRFRKSSDSAETPIPSITWTTISTSAAHAGSSPTANTTSLIVGASSSGVSPFTGSIDKVQIVNGSSVTVASPNFTTQPPGATSFADAQGNVWTVNAPASIVEGGNIPEWTIHVQTKQSETPDAPQVGEASPTIEEIVAAATPAGFEFIHETVAG